MAGTQGGWRLSSAVAIGALILAGCAPADLTAARPRGDDPPQASGKKPSVTGGATSEGEDTDSDTPPDDTWTDPVDPVWVDPGAPVDQVCYPSGACLPVFEPAMLPGGYEYAPRTGQYRAPEAWLDLDTASPTTPVAASFRLEELAAPTKGQLAVVQPHAIASLQQVRDAVGPLRVNSGYRSPSYNASVGGVSSSRHQYGDAFDLAPTSNSLEALEAACHARGASYVGVYVSHIHCDWRDDTLEPAFYGASGRSAVDSAAPALIGWIEADGDALIAPSPSFDEGEPLREWFAYDSRGRLVATGNGPRFEPPVGAVEVAVEIGRSLWVEYPLR